MHKGSTNNANNNSNNFIPDSNLLNLLLTARNLNSNSLDPPSYYNPAAAVENINDIEIRDNNESNK